MVPSIAARNMPTDMGIIYQTRTLVQHKTISKAQQMPAKTLVRGENDAHHFGRGDTAFRRLRDSPVLELSTAIRGLAGRIFEQRGPLVHILCRGL